MIRFHFCSFGKYFSLCFMRNPDFYYNRKLTSTVRKRRDGTMLQPGLQYSSSEEPQWSVVSTVGPRVERGSFSLCQPKERFTSESVRILSVWPNTRDKTGYLLVQGFRVMSHDLNDEAASESRRRGRAKGLSVSAKAYPQGNASPRRLHLLKYS